MKRGTFFPMKGGGGASVRKEWYPVKRHHYTKRCYDFQSKSVGPVVPHDRRGNFLTAGSSLCYSKGSLPVSRRAAPFNNTIFT